MKDRQSQIDDSRYRQLVEAIADYAIYMLDPQGAVTSWNPGVERLGGYAAEEVLGAHFSRFWAAEDREAGRPEAALETAAREGLFESEGWRLRKDGSRCWTHTTIRPMRDASGAAAGFAVVTRDLTARKAADDALRRSQEEFRLLVQGVTDYAIYMLDPQGVVSNWNLGAERIKGYRREEIVGRHFSVFYTEEDRAAGEPARALATAATQGRFEKESQRVRKSGERFWAHVVIDPIRNDAGDLIGFAKITRDVTERREAQRALETAREALFQSQKMDALGQLTGGVAHDFNNLLTAILGGLELVRRRMPENPRLSPLIDNAVQAAQRGATLTQRMLAFARRQPLEPEAVDIPRLVEGMSDLLRRSLLPSIRIDYEFAASLPAVRADANQLEMSLLNLAVNARDAMPAGGTLTFSGRAEALAADNAIGLPAGDYVRLAVADTGEGMDAETLRRAAEPFFTTKGVGKGTGLGLSMVHGLAEQLGGRLVMQSARGLGTTAELWLPAATAEGVALPAGSADAAPAPAKRTLRVLAVDDDAIVLTNTVAMLEDLGHSVVRVSSARQALDVLAADVAVDLLITDEVMPGMRGSELAEAARRRRPGLPVILATGFAELSPEAARDLPRLAKPFLQGDLRAAIAQAFPETAGAGG